MFYCSQIYRCVFFQTCISVLMRCTWKLPREKHLEHLLPVQGLVWRNNFVSNASGLWMNASLSAEKHAPERVVSRWFLRAGSIEEVSRLNIGFGFMRSWMKAGNIFLELDPRLDWHLHMLTQGRQGRSWDKSASRVGRSLSLVDQLMTAFLPEKECAQVTWVKSQFWLFVNCSLEVDKAIFICK